MTPSSDVDSGASAASGATGHEVARATKSPPVGQGGAAEERAPDPATGSKTTDSRSGAALELNATLTISSYPWAYIEIDGQRMSKTSIERWPVTPGAHTITLIKAGKEPVSQRVDLKPGQNIKRVYDFNVGTWTVQE